MADQFRHEDLIFLPHRRAAAQLFHGFKDMIEGGPDDRTPISVLMALGMAFANICESHDVDPMGALEQILEAAEQGQLSLKDDPARGQFIHPMGRA